MSGISIFHHVFGHIEGSSVSYDFSKPYSESGENTELDEPKISISNFFLGMVYTALCILETYIGNIVVWKHHLHLETKNVYWKHALDIQKKSDIGNIRIRLETYSAYWKHILHIKS